MRPRPGPSASIAQSRVASIIATAECTKNGAGGEFSHLNSYPQGVFDLPELPLVDSNFPGT
jgi:hypothetical protein